MDDVETGIFIDYYYNEVCFLLFSHVLIPLDAVQDRRAMHMRSVAVVLQQVIMFELLQLAHEDRIFRKRDIAPHHGLSPTASKFLVGVPRGLGNNPSFIESFPLMTTGFCQQNVEVQQGFGRLGYLLDCGCSLQCFICFGSLFYSNPELPD